MYETVLRRIDRCVSATLALGRALVLPVSLLLFLQWPLRDVVHAFSNEANDLAQWLFALYVSLALTFATREGTHLAADALAQRYSATTRSLIRRWAALLFIVPWSLFVLIAGAPTAWRSVIALEEFPETYDPFYFVIKASTCLLALLMLLQALLDVASRARPT